MDLYQSESITSLAPAASPLPWCPEQCSKGQHRGHNAHHLGQPEPISPFGTSGSRKTSMRTERTVALRTPSTTGMTKQQSDHYMLKCLKEQRNKLNPWPKKKITLHLHEIKTSGPRTHDSTSSNHPASSKLELDNFKVVPIQTRRTVSSSFINPSQLQALRPYRLAIAGPNESPLHERTKTGIGTPSCANLAPGIVPADAHLVSVRRLGKQHLNPRLWLALVSPLVMKAATQKMVQITCHIQLFIGQHHS